MSRQCCFAEEKPWGPQLTCRKGFKFLTQTTRIHLYSKKLENVGQIFTYSKVSFEFHRGKVVFSSGLNSVYCLSHQLAVKFYLKWKHSQVFAVPSPMGNHKSNPCLQQECPPGPSGNSKTCECLQGRPDRPRICVFPLSLLCKCSFLGGEGAWLRAEPVAAPVPSCCVQHLGV